MLAAVNLTAGKLTEIEAEIDKQAHALPRVDILRQSIAKSIIVKASSVDEAIAFSNDYAPEHLILHLENANQKIPQINNAGSVFVGPYTPERSLASFQSFVRFLSLIFNVVAVITRLAPITPYPQMVTPGNSAASTRRLIRSISRRRK